MVGLVADILAAQVRAKSVLKKIKGSVLFLVSGEDMIADPEVSRKVFDGLKAKDKTFRGFPDMYHSLSIDLGKEAVFEELFKWVDMRMRLKA